MPLVQYGMKTNSAYPGLLTKNGHARLCVILSTSSGFEISVNEEKISKADKFYHYVKHPREPPASFITKRAQAKLHVGICSAGGRLGDGGSHIMSVETRELEAGFIV